MLAQVSYFPQVDGDVVAMALRYPGAWGPISRWAWRIWANRRHSWAQAGLPTLAEALKLAIQPPGGVG